MQDLEGLPVSVGDRVVIETNDGIKRATILKVQTRVAIVQTTDGLIRTTIPERMLKYG